VSALSLHIESTDSICACRVTLSAPLYIPCFTAVSLSVHTHIQVGGLGGRVFTAALSLSHTHTHMQVAGCRGIFNDETIDIKFINDLYLSWMSCVVAEDSNPPLQEHMMTSLFALDPWHGGLVCIFKETTWSST